MMVEVSDLVTECAICCGVQPCFDDGEAFICADRAACQARCQEALVDIPSVLEVDEPASEFYAQAQPPAPICHNCAGPHHVQRCPEIGTALVNWSEGPVLSPVEALRLALERGIFGLPETVDKLRASLAAADQKAIEDAEQLAHARDSVAINLQMRQIEAALFDLPC